MGSPYQQDWDDCLDAVIRILQRAEAVKDDAKG